MTRGLTSKIKQFYLKQLPGMNNKVEDLDLAKNHVELAQNCRFEDHPGAVAQRPPIAYFNDTSTGAGAVQSLYRMYTSGGVKKWIKIWTTKAYVGSDAAGTWTEIRSGLTTGKKTSFVTYKDITIASNGYDNPWCYDGSSDNVTWELGSCKAKLSSGAGNLDAEKDYYYAVVFNTTAAGDGTNSGITGAVSNTVTTTASIQKIALSNIPLGPSGTGSRVIYRTEGDGSTLYKIAVIGNNTATTYTDNIADTTASAYPAVADDMPVGRILKLHRERLFMSGDPSNPNKVYYSEAYLPHYIRQTTNLDYMQIDENDGDEIVGVPIQLGVMLCVKRNTIRKLHITAPTSGADPTTWYAEDPSSWNGCAAWQTVVQTPYGVAYLGWDHWYMYDGAKSTPIIDEFDTYEILNSQYTEVVAHWDRGDLVWSYTDRTSASQTKNRVARYNFKRKALSFDTYTVSSDPVGVECFASRYGDSENNELFMGDAANGYVYKSNQFDIEYALRTKTECNAGSLSDIFIGGTESSPTIQIGEIQSASAIPDDVCIFWDNPDREPEDSNGDSSGWTEITDKDDKYIKIDTGTAGTTGTVGTTVSVANQVTTDADEITYVNYRVFKKNANTTEYEYPNGAIVMWDQSSTPTGYVSVPSGRYVKINDDLSNPTGKDYIYTNEESDSDAQALDNTLEFRFIKKIGETDTWDGVNKYVYALYYTTGDPGNDFSNVSSTYDNCFIKTSTDGPTQTEGDDTEYNVDLLQLPSTYSSYTGGSDGPHGIDGDTSTSHKDQYASTGDSASGTVTLYSTHTWDTAKTITKVTCYLDSAASSTSTYSATQNTYAKVEYTTDGENWSTLGSLSDSDSGSSTGDVSSSLNTTWTGSQAGVKGIRAYAAASSGGSGGSSTATGSANIYNLTCECEPYDTVTFNLVKKLLGKHKDYNKAIGTKYTSGTWTSPSMEINANSFKKMYWNETILAGTTNVVISTRSGADQATCEAADWHATTLSEPNGSDVASTAAEWFQYKIDLTADDTRTSNPMMYFSNGHLLKFDYRQQGSDVDDAVEFRYKIGLRNFDLPMVDKIYKKLIMRHDGTKGSYLVKWETEHSSGEFTIDLTSYPKQWDSFFPSDAFGKEMLLEIYKNDLYDFKLKEFSLLYTPEPILI